MPVHDMECRECGRRVERYVAEPCVEEKCEVVGCEGYMRVVYDWGTCNNIEVFKPYWETNLGDKPVYIESNKHLAKECRERGLWAKRLDGGYKSY